MLAGELLPRSGPCPHAARSAPGCKCQVLALHSGSRAWPHRPPAEGRSLGVSLLTAHPALLEPDPGTSGQSLRALLEEFGAAAGRVARQVGRGSQQGFSPFYPCWPTAAESWQWAAKISRGVEEDLEPAARILSNSREARSPCGWGRHSQSAECSTRGPCDRRSRDVASFLPRLPGVWDVCCEKEGGKFQHLCCCALWSLDGNRDFGSVFTSGHLLYQGMSAVGVIEAGWKVTRERRVRKPGF